TNLGHLEAAAGIAGLIKVALALKNRSIPPSLHFRQPNPHIPFAEFKLRVQDQLTGWPSQAAPARAGVSAFGFGGTNAHVVLEEAPAADAAQNTSPANDDRRTHILPLSAHNEVALRDLVRAYLDEVLYSENVRQAASLSALPAVTDSGGPRQAASLSD